MNNLIAIKRVNDANFQERVLECSKPVIVVFEKSCWGTAHIMKPVLEQISSAYADKIKIYKYDLEENAITSAYYRIENSTTVLFFYKGNVIFKTGAISKDEFKKIINSFLKNSLN